MSERFGFDAPKDIPIEDSVAWAGRNGFHYIDFQADLPPNDAASFDAARVHRVRALCDAHQVAIGIHTSSAVNVAALVPVMARAVSGHVLTNLELAQRLGCGWIVAHGGYHFGDLQRRRTAAVEQLKRLVSQAEGTGVVVFLENHNKEPEQAEIHYIPHNVEETRWFFEAVGSPHLKWAFNVAHAHLVPEGWRGFLDAFGVANVGQVRLNDNMGTHEVHLVPGEGNIDFQAVFAALAERGYGGWFSLGFGDRQDKVRVRDWFVSLL
jgi:sugar phosphate isomerase/epimerase